MAYLTKDSGERVNFPTGSVRDTQDGKPRYDLVGIEGYTRLALLMARGAEKYGENNWRLGQKSTRYFASALRHLMQWAMGDNSEDHLAAVAFNVFGIMHLEEKMPQSEYLDHERYQIKEQTAEDEYKQELTDEFYDGPKEIDMVQVNANLRKRGLLRGDQGYSANQRLYCRECNRWHEIVHPHCDFFTRDDNWAE